MNCTIPLHRATGRMAHAPTQRILAHLTGNVVQAAMVDVHFQRITAAAARHLVSCWIFRNSTEALFPWEAEERELGYILSDTEV